MTPSQEAVISRIKRWAYPLERKYQRVIYSGFDIRSGFVCIPLERRNGGRIWVYVSQDGSKEFDYEKPE